MVDEQKEFLGFSDAPSEFGEIPSGRSADVFQGYSDTCAIRSQELILRDYGIMIPQEQLIEEATQRGWYANGTPTACVGNLLELHNIPVCQYENGNIFSLVGELSQGHKVIVAVDANELWGQTGILHDAMEWVGWGGSGNHALIVSNIDTTNPDDIRVILTDPGTGDVAKSYSMAEFEDAWSDSSHFMVATQEPVPASAPYMANFDYEMGHLPEVYGMPYDEFQTSFASLGNLSTDDPEFQIGFSIFGQRILDYLHSFGLFDSDGEKIVPEASATPSDPFQSAPKAEEMEFVTNETQTEETDSDIEADFDTEINSEVEADSDTEIVFDSEEGLSADTEIDPGLDPSDWV